MNSESNTSKQAFSQVDSAKHLNEVDTPDLDEEDPYSWNGPSNALLGFAIAIGMTTLSFVVGDRKPDNEKLSAYECGFEAFDDARGRFDVRFYLVAILFIIFDLEVAFLFPWAVSLGSIGIFGFWSMMIFLLIVTIGFIYEWKKGALEWE